MKSLTVKVRAANNPGSEQNLKLASRVYVGRDSLIELTSSVEDGKLITIEPVAGGVRREAMLWTAPNKLVNVALMSEPFRTACGFAIGDQIRISYDPSRVVSAATEIVLKEATADGSDTSQLMDDEDRQFWQVFFRKGLGRVETVFPGMLLRLQADFPVPTLTVVSVNGSGALGRCNADTAVKIISGNKGQSGEEGATSIFKLEVAAVPGREGAVQRLNAFLNRFNNIATTKCPPFFKLGGLIIHGARGTGKTMLLDEIASAGTAWGTVHRIPVNAKSSEITEIMGRARDAQPSMVFLDGLEKLLSKERSNYEAVALALCNAFDRLMADAKKMGQLPRVLIVATCLDHVLDIPAELRDPGRFNHDLYLPLPDVLCRNAILSSFDIPFNPSKAEDILRTISERTHAYNIKDLYGLIGRACEYWEDLPRGNSNDSTMEPYLPLEMITMALKDVRPSAMHDINLKPPPIAWDDICGQDSVKTSLGNALKIALAPKEAIKKVIRRPPKGILLYGPPGCSKTMAAQALATNSGLNFFAVKGAELLNMYVGETERAIRRVFQRARDVAPSIVFFDEFDSIAGQRSGFQSGNTGAKAGGHEALNVVTTLLNEMDGFENMEGVLVLAATNAPHAIDPALLRPGRFGEVIYVGPPDRDAREAIFRRQMAEMSTTIDIGMLAEQTEGHSGAEVQNICDSAGLSALHRWTAAGEAGSPNITMEDMNMALKVQRKQITKEMIAAYEEWEQQFRRN